MDDTPLLVIKASTDWGDCNLKASRRGVGVGGKGPALVVPGPCARPLPPLPSPPIVCPPPTRPLAPLPSHTRTHTRRLPTPHAQAWRDAAHQLADEVFDNRRYRVTNRGVRGGRGGAGGRWGAGSVGGRKRAPGSGGVGGGRRREGQRSSPPDARVRSSCALFFVAEGQGHHPQAAHQDDDARGRADRVSGCAGGAAHELACVRGTGAAADADTRMPPAPPSPPPRASPALQRKQGDQGRLSPRCGGSLAHLRQHPPAHRQHMPRPTL